jgi:pilus assembly protein CpaB
VAAAVEIPFGVKVDASHIKLVQVPSATVPARSFSSPEEVIGRVATQSLYPGEILLDGRLAAHDGGSALSAVIAQGKRAVTVRVNDVVGVAGFLLPGNRVDVLQTRRNPGGRGSVSHTLLQDMKVLAVDQTASPDRSEPVIVRAVTLEATPEQAEQIVQATAQGKLQMTLRNPLDGSRQEERIAAVMPDAAKQPVPHADAVVVEELRRVMLIRGTAVSTTDIRF